MRKLLLIMVFAVYSLSNSSAVLGVEKTSRLVPDGADQTVWRYFPAGAWGKPMGARTQEERERAYERWFGNRLADMNEPSLAAADSSEREPNEIRVLLVPAFSRTTMLRMSYSDKQKASFEFKTLMFPGDEKHGLIPHTTGTVDKGDADRIFALLEAIDPWSDAVAPDVRSFCYDGTQVVLEFREDDAYKVITRHQCELPVDDNIRKLIYAFDEVVDGWLILTSFDAPDRM